MAANQSQIVAGMGAGWNLGNQLEASVNGMPSETHWGNPVITPSLITAVKAAGFSTIRIPVSYLDKIGPAPAYAIDAAWLARIKEVVDYVYSQNMYAIINIHGDGYTTTTGAWLLVGSTDQTTIKAKYQKVWQQVATTFAGYDERLIFESMNEEFDGTWNTPAAAYYANLNDYNQIFVNTVRQTGSNNGTRWLLVPGWNTSIDYTAGDYGFVVPSDNFRSATIPASEKRLMISVHYYSPWDFCGEETATITQWGATSANASKKSTWGQEDYMDSQLKSMRDKFATQGYPVVIGEFGSVDKTSADATNNAYRAKFAEILASTAKKYGAVPVIWDNGYNGSYGMGLFDRSTRSVTQPGIISSIMSGLTTRSAFSPIEAESYYAQSGIQTENASEGGQDIGFIQNGDYAVYHNVDFGNYASSFEARVASGSGGGNLEVRLDGIAGALVGTCSVAGTGGWQNWTTVSCNVSGATGIHNVYLKFTGGGGYLFNVNWFKFTSRIQAESFSSQSGIQTEACGEGGQDIGYIQSGDYAVYNNVNFGNNTSLFEARVASGSSGGNIEIRLDGIAGALVGTCSVAGTGGWQNWTTATCNVSGATGIHNVYLKFTGGGGYLFNVNWFKFTSPIQAENYSAQSGIQAEACGEGGQNIGYIQNGDYVVYNHVDLGSNASLFEARVAGAGSGGNIEIRLDGIAGALVGTCPVAGTGGWQNWTTATCNLSGASGIHNVYLKFTGGGGYLFNVNWFKFTQAGAAN